MKRNAFALKLGLVGFMGIALASCGTSSSVATGSSNSTTSGTSSSASSSVEATLATGAKSYAGADYAEKTKILGKLEGYAVKNHLTGLPLYENGGYVMYNDRVVKGTENYIVGYGFSNLRDGYIKSNMAAANEPVAAWQGYYHTWDSTDPNSLNALDDKGSQVDNLYSYISSSYFGNKMNSTKTGYDWYGVLSTDDRPVAIDTETGNVIENATSTTTSDTWRIHVKTGEKGGIKYRSASSIANRKAYDGTYVQLEDYITPFKDILLNGSVNYYRGSELAAKTGKSGIVGAADYFKATKADGADSDAAAAAWAKVGIKSGTDSTGDYIQFQFMAPTNRFYAMYNTTSGLYEPVPKSFFTLVGKDNYAKFSTDGSSTPVDNVLNLGPYMLEAWQSDKEMSFKRNNTWYEINASTYRIPGVHIKFLPGYTNDDSAAFKEFLAGNIDSATIPMDYLSQYKTDPRTTTVPGDSVFNLNINSCSQARWNELFGAEGSIAQTAESEYYQCKPWMANSDFLDGMSLAIDRETYSTARGSTPSCNYFGSAYMSDPENGVSYNNTTEHKEAMESVYGDAYDTYGYSLEGAKAKFKKAVASLKESDSTFAAGVASATTANPYNISITISWMYSNMITKYGDDVSKFIQDAFNNESVSGGLVKLTVNNVCHNPTDWSDVYYNVMMVGQFDLAFGSISGNTLDPLNFLEVLKSDNSSGMTLNWGLDTSALDESSQLIYDNSIWSFDTLWDAADHGVLVKSGVSLPAVVTKYGTGAENDDGTFTFTFTYENAMDNTDFASDVASGKLKIVISDFYIWNGGKYQENFDSTTKADDLEQLVVSFDEATATYTVTLSAALYSAVHAAGGFYIGVEYDLVIDGISNSGLKETEVDF